MRIILAASLLLAVTFTACKKEKTEPFKDTSAAADNALAEATYNDAKTIADQAATDGILSNYKGGGTEGLLISNCATITHDTTLSPRLLTVDFGNTNCLCTDGRYRRGKVKVSYIGTWRDSASTATISFDNYFVNDYKVLGTKTISNKGHNSAGNLWYSLDVNGSLIDPAGKTMTWASNRTNEWVAGENTQGLFGWLDDVYHVRGTASGTSFGGSSYTVSITDPLVVALNCRWIKQGKFTLQITNSPALYADYGTGACDNQGTVTINGNVFVVYLR